MDQHLDGVLVAMEAALRVNLSIDGILPLLEREAGGFMVKEEKMRVTSVDREDTPERVSRMISILRKKGNNEFYRFLDILDNSGNEVWANKLRERVTPPSRKLMVAFLVFAHMISSLNVPACQYCMSLYNPMSYSNC